ncbi:hypothetical protein S7711_11373 [Stachybotrys chartarum IBT 7711]|uniref:Uncharacterized protein n=1 Tax=Stachybotrys chartarum (strain CBS 109288 / IBT 7711) TaxID=1280523 RepID=A0A084ALA7_STACB|nr:hypothetical protein S7711_11373 [Stachybotrys chartarum IBT 7711]
MDQGGPASIPTAPCPTTRPPYGPSSKRPRVFADAILLYCDDQQPHRTTGMFARAGAFHPEGIPGDCGFNTIHRLGTTWHSALNSDIFSHLHHGQSAAPQYSRETSSSLRPSRGLLDQGACVAARPATSVTFVRRPARPHPIPSLLQSCSVAPPEGPSCRTSLVRWILRYSFLFLHPCPAGNSMV